MNERHGPQVVMPPVPMMPQVYGFPPNPQGGMPMPQGNAAFQGQPGQQVPQGMQQGMALPYQIGPMGLPPRTPNGPPQGIPPLPGAGNVRQ